MSYFKILFKTLDNYIYNKYIQDDLFTIYKKFNKTYNTKKQ